MTRKSDGSIVLRRSTAIIIVVAQFVILAMIGWVTLDTRNLHRFDQRRDYDVCIGSTTQIERVVDKLLLSNQPVPPDATDEEKAAIQVRNQRSAMSRGQVEATIRDIRNDCKVYLHSKGGKK